MESLYAVRKRFALSAMLGVVVAGLALAGCKNSKSVPPEKTGSKANDPTTDVAREVTSTGAKEEVVPEPNGLSEDLASDPAPPMTGGSDSAGSPAEEESWTQNGAWTTQRLVALGNGGPTVVDLFVSVDEQSLEENSRAMVESIAEQLFDGLEAPVSWGKLIEHPLVKSGWLGNLVPEEDQVDQLIGMYDSTADNLVSVEELSPFLSKGLSRNRALQISDIGNAPGTDTSSSPWGKLDRNQDYTLDSVDLAEIPEALEKFDYNGDSIISLLELNEARGRMQQSNSMGSMNSMGSSMLDTTSLLLPSTADSSDESAYRRSSVQFSQRLLERYTFSIDIPREVWSSWTDARWDSVDSDHDGVLTRKELEALLEIPADTQVYLRLPGLNSESAESYLIQGKAYDSENGTWSRTSVGGKFAMAGFIGNLQVQDSYTRDARNVLKTRLNSALKQPQLQAFFTGQLQLQEGAFELIDANEDQELDDEEFGRVWEWLSSRQGARMLVRWMLSDRPWFEILDQDGDQRLTEVELSQGAEHLLELDMNADGLLTPNEMPLIVRAEFDRSDSRLQLNQLFGMGNEEEDSTADADWYSAMDTNRDGYLAKEEFFGDAEEFAASDKNQDGFLSRSEVYEP